MTVAEYIDKLERDAPKNVPMDYLARSGTLIMSRNKWDRFHAEMRCDLLHDAAGVRLHGYPVGLVDVDGVEQLVPDDSAIAFLEVGDYVIRCGKLYHVTGVGAYGPKKEGRQTDIALVSDITFPK